MIHTPLRVVLKCWLWCWDIPPPSFSPCVTSLLRTSPSFHSLPSQHQFCAFLPPLSLFFSFLRLHLTPSAFSVLGADGPPCPHLLNTAAVASQACSWAAASLLIRPVTAACLSACMAVSLKLWLRVCLLVVLFTSDFLHACLCRPPRYLQG